MRFVSALFGIVLLSTSCGVIHETKTEKQHQFINDELSKIINTLTSVIEGADKEGLNKKEHRRYIIYKVVAKELSSLQAKYLEDEGFSQETYFQFKRLLINAVAKDSKIQEISALSEKEIRKLFED